MRECSPSPHLWQRTAEALGFPPLFLKATHKDGKDAGIELVDPILWKEDTTVSYILEPIFIWESVAYNGTLGLSRYGRV